MAQTGAHEKGTIVMETDEEIQARREERGSSPLNSRPNSSTATFRGGSGST
eukprot:CAMPEP_0172086024 /NCGR_PEP_ID=MMETSP1043-20130122/21877_1 /TAXON_ID=464988 /ORGANISM="Hemiselmis andersenii, Strain CCMP441" /LENGTH=50 /DNA_ID=CAMNT_0012748029 /DNA_START=14 /DNA_END=162 /DNA_ORIENTATION=+